MTRGLAVQAGSEVQPAAGGATITHAALLHHAAAAGKSPNIHAALVHHCSCGILLQGRAHLARTLLRWGKALGARPEVAHDSVLVMDRVMSTGIEVGAFYCCQRSDALGGHVEAVVGGPSTVAPGLQPVVRRPSVAAPEVFMSLASDRLACRACVQTWPAVHPMNLRIRLVAMHRPISLMHGCATTAASCSGCLAGPLGCCTSVRELFDAGGAVAACCSTSMHPLQS